MQLGSLKFIRNDTLLRFGGYGFFENRNFFTFYMIKMLMDGNLLILTEILYQKEFQILFIILIKINYIYLEGYTYDKFKKDVKYPNLKILSL